MGRTISPNFIFSLFGVSAIDQVEEHVFTTLGSTGDPMAIRVAAVIAAVRQQRFPTVMKVTSVRQGDPHESKFFTYLYNDATPGMQVSLADWKTRMNIRSQTTAAPLPPQPPQAGMPPQQLTPSMQPPPTAGMMTGYAR